MAKKRKAPKKIQVSTQQILRFMPGTRLLCNSCGLVSNNHHVMADSLDDYTYYDHTTTGVIHICKACGYSDDFGDGFTDSGNYECYDTQDLHKWQEELRELENEVDDLKHKIAKAEARWAELWYTKEDAR